MFNTASKLAPLSAAFVVLGATALLAAGTHSGSHDNEADIGKAGADHIDRTIEVDMGEMYFSPGDLNIRAGESVLFKIRNSGDLVHEFSLGTEAMHAAHEEEMMSMMESGVLEGDRINQGMMGNSGMQHDDPNSVLLEPGDTAELIWTFDGDAEVELSCNVPGHREGGMVGSIRITES